MSNDEYDDHDFDDDGTDMHLCKWGRGHGAECGDGADSQNHRNDPDVITTPLAEILGDERDDTNFSLDAVVAALRDASIPAYVAQTGGGIATIFAGTPVKATTTDHLNEPHEYDQYPILAGPGWFEGPGWTDGHASTAEFYIGPDDDDDNYVTLADVFTDDGDAVATAVRLITEAVRTAEGTTTT